MIKYCVLIFLSVIFSVLLTSYSSNPPIGNTGSISDGQTCGNGGCHVGGDVASNCYLVSDIPSSGYIGGQTYNMTATVYKIGAVNFGFQASPQDDLGNGLGSLISGAGSVVNTDSRYINHNGSITSADTASWNFSWTAPPTGTGNVTFYAAFIAGYGTNGPSGDSCFRTSLILNEDTTLVGINSKIVSKDEVKLFPNPTSDFIEITFPKGQFDTQVNIYDLAGNHVGAFERNMYEHSDFSKKYSLNHLSRGTYLLRISSKSYQRIKKIIIL